MATSEYAINNAPLIAIVGETASGKSALALDLAYRYNGEIIAADSWTVYRGFDIGTAKPSPADQAKVRHHLLDIADPAQGFSAPQFKQRALTAMADIHRRGKVPVLVGGTGLYVDSVLYDFQFLPAPDPALRERLNGLDLAQLVRLAAERQLNTSSIDLRNKRRVIRLIETNGAVARRAPLRSNTLILGLRPSRLLLRTRVEQRVCGMLAAGLADEAAAMAERYGWQAEPMKGIGYREFYEYFHGSQNLDRTAQRIVAATIGLAKRQRTWFNRNSGIQVRTDPKEFVDLITTFLHT